MSAEMTPLFPSSVAPVHIGVYNVEPDFQQWFAYWDGKGFGWLEKSAESAVISYRDDGVQHPKLSWRGLASKPAGVQP